jgi:hypothetical protein
VLEKFIRVNMLHGYFGLSIQIFNIYVCVCGLRGERGYVRRYLLFGMQTKKKNS